ncbi:MAG: hypothetical protein MUC64_14920 [Rubritepida sp.]|jgi:hypothetical protein|nr:hypothetical protein [Rubritepida sp.]
MPRAMGGRDVLEADLAAAAVPHPGAPAHEAGLRAAEVARHAAKAAGRNRIARA